MTDITVGRLDPPNDPTIFSNLICDTSHNFSICGSGNFSHRIDETKSHTPTPTQPYGWRVKLYRLNADGGWDDCGTGRIRFRLLHTGGTVARGVGTIAGVVAVATGGGGGTGRRSGGGGGGSGGRIKDRSGDGDGEEGLGGVVGEAEDGGDAGWLEMGEEDVYRVRISFVWFCLVLFGLVREFGMARLVCLFVPQLEPRNRVVVVSKHHLPNRCVLDPYGRSCVFCLWYGIGVF